MLRSYYSNMDPTYSDRPAASIGRSPRSDAGHPVPDQADFSGQPLDLPTNPASMEAGLRQDRQVNDSYVIIKHLTPVLYGGDVYGAAVDEE